MKELTAIFILCVLLICGICMSRKCSDGSDSSNATNSDSKNKGLGSTLGAPLGPPLGPGTPVMPKPKSFTIGKDMKGKEMCVPIDIPAGVLPESWDIFTNKEDCEAVLENGYNPKAKHYGYKVASVKGKEMCVLNKDPKDKDVFNDLYDCEASLHNGYNPDPQRHMKPLGPHGEDQHPQRHMNPLGPHGEDQHPQRHMNPLGPHGEDQYPQRHCMCGNCGKKQFIMISN